MQYRKEVIGDCTLYLGDCLEVMPTLEPVDAVVTDPPYGIQNIVKGYGRGGLKTIANDRNLEVCHAALEQAKNLMVNGWILAFYSCKVTPLFMAFSPDLYFGEIVWDKKVPGLGGGFRYQHENAAIYKIGKPRPLNPGFSIIEDCRNPDQHPHQKPQTLMKKILDIVHGEITLDPFMGSGSTGVACVKLGRKFIGIEKDPEYFRIACDRIQKAYDQPDLFIPQPQKAVQEKLI